MIYKTQKYTKHNMITSINEWKRNSVNESYNYMSGVIPPMSEWSVSPNDRAKVMTFKIMDKIFGIRPGTEKWFDDSVCKTIKFKYDKIGIQHMITLPEELKSHEVKESVSLPGLDDAMKEFDPFTIVGSRRDPGYGYDHVSLLLIKFTSGEYGLAIYDSDKREFIEEPATLSDYDTTLERVCAKYGFDINNLTE